MISIYTIIELRPAKDVFSSFLSFFQKIPFFLVFPLESIVESEYGGKMKRVESEKSNKEQIIICTVYEGGIVGNIKDNPINKVMKVSNQGGFRQRVSKQSKQVKYIVLYSSGEDLEWPDELDVINGQFVYYWDNKKPGHLLQETARNGNVILRESFDLLNQDNRIEIPPFFIFTKEGIGRNVVFRGVAVPGGPYVRSEDELVAVWKSKNNTSFQNYRAIFSILNIDVVNNEW